MRSLLFICLTLALPLSKSMAQCISCDINMSFERAAGDCDGEKTQPCLPDNFDGNWITCNYPGGGPATSDIQPGQYGFTEAPTDGSSYMSFWASGGSGTAEANGERTALELCSPLEAGTQYCFTLDYVRPAGGFNAPSILLIEGGMSACNAGEILFQSAETSTPAPGTWGTWTFCFTPAQNWTHLRFRAVDGPSGGFGGYLGIDNWVSTDGNFPPSSGSNITLQTSGDQSICEGEQVNLNVVPSGGITPYTYAWTPTTGLSDPNISNPVAQPNQTTTYTVNVTDSAGCSQSKAITITVNPVPVVMVAPDSTCAGSCVSLSATGATTYTWSPVTGLSDPNSANPQACPTSTTTYTVSGVTGNGCQHDTTVTVKIFDAPVADAGPDVSYCAGDSAQLNGSGSGGTSPYTYIWSPSQGLSDPNIANPFSTTNQNTTLYLTVTDAKGCMGVDSVLVTVQPGPCSISAFLSASPSQLCPGECTDLTAAPSGGTSPYTFQWNQGISPAAGPHNVCPNTTTSYSVTITDANGDTASASIQVTVFSAPASTTTSTNSNCGQNNGSVTVTASGQAPYMYLWSPGAYTTATVSGLSAGNYYVTVNDGNGCTTNDTATVGNIGGPTSCFDADTTAGCSPLDVQFSNCSNGAVTYEWDFGDNSASTSGTPTHQFSAAGCYDITLVCTSANGCTDTLTRDCFIEVYPDPQAQFQTSPEVVNIFNPEVSFTDFSAGAVQWLWYFGDRDTSGIQNPTHVYADTGSYTVMLTIANSYGCVDTALGVVYIEDIPTFYVPDAFSPNGDGVNDLFFPLGNVMDVSRLELLVFDRWGNLIFEGNDWTGWDGRVEGSTEIVQEDVYVWVVRAWTWKGEQIREMGKVTVVH
ncbi:MAG: gliding motility-associated C-terminal domain-containing protein, partial [Flavobacteriales bacterium]|nr:gliding motility-associated C-terminal domain-containing protein [Flavobacteriales bacterium]